MTIERLVSLKQGYAEAGPHAEHLSALKAIVSELETALKVTLTRSPAPWDTHGKSVVYSLERVKHPSKDITINYPDAVQKVSALKALGFKVTPKRLGFDLARDNVAIEIHLDGWRYIWVTVTLMKPKDRT